MILDVHGGAPLLGEMLDRALLNPSRTRQRQTDFLVATGLAAVCSSGACF